MALTEMRVNLCQNGSFTKDTFWWWSWKSEIAAENGRLRIKAQDANGFNKVAITQRVNLGGPAATDQRWRPSLPTSTRPPWARPYRMRRCSPCASTSRGSRPFTTQS